MLTSIPEHVTADVVEALFRPEPGFVALRTVRKRYFVDFEENRLALSAMRKYQGHDFGGAGAGIAIDLDNGGKGPEDRSSETHRRKQAMREQLMATDAYGCSLCAEVVMHLEPGHDLAAMPRRSTDGAIAVSEPASLRRLRICRGPKRLLRAVSGAAEWQFPLCCPNCNVLLGYRTQPPGKACEWMYVHQGSLALSRRARVATSTHDGEGAGAEAEAEAEDPGGAVEVAADGPGGVEPLAKRPRASEA